jgi:hypothetical protein
MKKNIGMVLPLVLSFFSFGFFLSGSLPIGAPIPKGQTGIKDISGKQITLQEARKDGGLLVMFSCNTCPVVIRNQARTIEICRYAQGRNIGVVLLNSNEGSRADGDSYTDMQSYAKEQHYNWYYALDQNHELADAFGANRTPEIFLFDRNGKLAYHGAIDDSPTDPSSVKRHHLKEAIDEMISGNEVTVKESRSIGCSIRR